MKRRPRRGASRLAIVAGIAALVAAAVAGLADATAEPPATAGAAEAARDNPANADTTDHKENLDMRTSRKD